MRGIILTGGPAEALGPLTRAVSKQLLPVYDKPMLCYPLAGLIQAGIREVLVITAPEDLPHVQRFGDGHEIGMRLEYAAQPDPGDVDQAIGTGLDFIDNAPVALIAGDGIFHGEDFVSVSSLIADFAAAPKGAKIYTHRVATRHRNTVRAGLYLYDDQAAGIARSLIPSQRSATGLHRVSAHYTRAGQLTEILLYAGTAWLSVHTAEDLDRASVWVRTIEDRQGIKIGCVEEAAWRAGLIDAEQLRELAEPLRKSGYGQYLLNLLNCGPGQQLRSLASPGETTR
ncbi:sugar phosphate nucleotidyltransferase [Kitasatospora sp. NPDC048722]|uniref:sugar phosphate nucleotidyltransferase n=1 Tax=Kitasatospora sp. NPDC048722 TaxID=3155639 RepID=UPI0033D4EEA2